MAFDAAGNLYFGNGPSESFAGSTIRKIDSQGKITTVAGSDTAGFAGDGGPATAAQLSKPNGIAFDAQGNLYFADCGNHRVRKIDTAGIITTVAGNGTFSTYELDSADPRGC
jgi:sugar lactone lactonase YvrE